MQWWYTRRLELWVFTRNSLTTTPKVLLHSRPEKKPVPINLKTASPILNVGACLIQWASLMRLFPYSSPFQKTGGLITAFFFWVGWFSVLLFYYCPTRPQTWSIVEGSVGWRQKSSTWRVFSLVSSLGVIGLWFSAVDDPPTPLNSFRYSLLYYWCTTTVLLLNYCCTTTTVLLLYYYCTSY